jgi:prepilin-type N-terminal cleavage/methylation domain-containing protein
VSPPEVLFRYSVFQGRGMPACFPRLFLISAYSIPGGLNRFLAGENMNIRRTARRHFSKGFSLLELLAVVTILGIIAVVIIPHITMSAVAAKANANEQNKSEIDTAVERWWIEKGTWPANDLSDIAKDTNYFPEGLPKDPQTGTAYTLDATTHRAQ